MNLTDHFSFEEFERSETATRKGLDNHIPDGLIPNAQRVAEALEVIRTYYNDRVIRVSSGYRSQEVNRAIGGSKTSAHCFAEAADFTIQGVDNITVCREIPDIVYDFDQVIYEFGPTGWVHLGISKTMRKQLLTAIKRGGKTVYLSGIVEGGG